jgi:hypothetical protein
LSCPAGSPRRAGFTYAFNCGDGAGFDAFSTSSSWSCSTTETGTRTLRGKIETWTNALCDKLENGAIRAYRNQVSAQSGEASTANEAEILRALALDL